MHNRLEYCGLESGCEGQRSGLAPYWLVDRIKQDLKVSDPSQQEMQKNVFRIWSFVQIIKHFLFEIEPEKRIMNDSKDTTVYVTVEKQKWDWLKKLYCI